MVSCCIQSHARCCPVAVLVVFVVPSSYRPRACRGSPSVIVLLIIKLVVVVGLVGRVICGVVGRVVGRLVGIPTSTISLS